MRFTRNAVNDEKTDTRFRSLMTGSGYRVHLHKGTGKDLSGVFIIIEDDGKSVVMLGFQLLSLVNGREREKKRERESCGLQQLGKAARFALAQAIFCPTWEETTFVPCIVCVFTARTFPPVHIINFEWERAKECCCYLLSYIS